METKKVLPAVEELKSFLSPVTVSREKSSFVFYFRGRQAHTQVCYKKKFFVPSLKIIERFL